MITVLLAGCDSSTPVSIEEDEKLGSLPETIIEPDNNLSTPEKVELGRMLFWDPILSGNQDVACVTCHHPDNAYAENIDLSIGVGGHGLSETRQGGTLVKRNAPTILNTAYNGIDENGNYNPLNTFMFWDNRAKSLEAQALEPIKSMEEMRGSAFAEDDIIPEIINRLSANVEYTELFENAFGDSEINETRLAQAIAVFERSLVTFNSRFDQYAKGDNSALNQEEIRGLNAFIDAGCSACHSGSMFSDFELHQLPIEENEKLVAEGIVDEGVNNTFRTPSLRNVELTAPYMHNGTELTLRQAVTFYDEVSNPGNDPDLAELDFDEPEDATIDAIIAFLKTLTDENFDRTIPDRVPSGLQPGGNIE